MRGPVLSIMLVWLGIAACADSEPRSEPPSDPPCSDPAPLDGTFDARAPGYVVTFHAGVDTPAEVARLEESYGFTAQYVFTEALQGFAATFDANVRDMMRCEPSVAVVQHDGVFETD